MEARRWLFGEFGKSTLLKLQEKGHSNVVLLLMSLGENWWNLDLWIWKIDNLSKELRFYFAHNPNRRNHIDSPREASMWELFLAIPYPFSIYFLEENIVGLGKAFNGAD